MTHVTAAHVTELVSQVTLFWSPAIMLNHLAQPCVSLVQEHGQISNEAPGIGMLWELDVS